MLYMYWNNKQENIVEKWEKKIHLEFQMEFYV
jgi:hypothetical protein